MVEGNQTAAGSDWVRLIAHRASPLWDRLAKTGVPELTAARLERWREVLGDEAALRRRLESVGLDLQEFTETRPSVDWSEPPWCEILHELRLRPEPQVSSSSAMRERTLPFADVFVPWIQVAVERFAARAGDDAGVLQPPARQSFERQLLAHLTYLASRTLGLVFYEYRLQSAPASALIEHWCATHETFEIYDRFVAQMHRGGFLELLDRYPVLARLLCQSVLQWVDATAEFCARFRTDAAILDTSATTDWSASVQAVQGGLSDRHHNGRTVVHFTLLGGRQFIYKPRSLFGETIFYDLLALLNAGGGTKELKTPYILDRRTYGWMEFVSSKACETAEELHSYHRRMGMILCASFLLSATDLHYENIVAAAEHPVAVDLEMLFCGRRRGGQEPEGAATDLPPLLQIGMLPLRSWSSEYEGDLSALGDKIEPQAEVPGLCWTRANCDQMMATERKPDVSYGRHRPQINGRFVKATDYVENIVQGFGRTYDLILSRKEAISQLLAEANHPQSSGLRVIIRDSSNYGDMLEHLLKPAFLQDGLDRSIELEWLARPLSGPYEVRDGRCQIYDSELAAMERLDIPHFTVAQWEAFDLAGDEDFFRYHQERGNSVALGRLTCMNERDREDQIAIIRKVLTV